MRNLFAVGLLFVGSFAGCKKESCLGGGANCVVDSPCQALKFECASDGGAVAMEVRTLETNDGPSGLDALGGRGDVLLSNGIVRAVISGIGHENLLDTNGGALIDLSAGNSNDALNQMLQVVGILPKDSPNYTELRIIDERPTRVAVQLSGTLYHNSDIPIHTLYEMRPCEAGIRVRTEVVNGTPDPQLWALSDGFYWCNRSMLPFATDPGGGFSDPDIDLLDLDSLFHDYPLLSASTHSEPEASYSLVSCSQSNLQGFNSDCVSSGGLPREVIPPRDYRVFERFLAVSNKGDVAASADIAYGVRKQLYGDKLATVTGHVVRNRPISGERDAAVLITEGKLTTPVGSRIPRTQVVPAADGGFSAVVPAGRNYLIEVDSLGRKQIEKEFTIAGDLDVGDLPLPDHGIVSVTVSDGDTHHRLDAEVFVVPVDAATTSQVTGTLYGRFDTCSPWLGPPHGPSPACNRFLISREGDPVEVEILPGSYYFYAFHGPFFSLGRQKVDIAIGVQTIAFDLHALALQPPGTLSADLHVHGAASFDSSIPDADRVLSFAAADVQIIIATDHDNVYDYGPTLDALNLTDRMNAVSGVETTGHVPYLTVPNNPYPHVIGHYIFFPLAYDPAAPRHGGPQDEFVEPGELFDRVEPLYTGLSIIQLNHPWAEPEFGRDLGFPRAIGLNTFDDLPEFDDGTAGGMYIRSPAGGHANNDHHAQEVMNGTNNESLQQYRAFWFYTLNQGQIKTGTANSDSHGLSDDTVGSPRNIIYTNTVVGPAFDINRLNQSIRDGTSFGSNGPVITATVTAGAAEGGGNRSFSIYPFTPAPSAM